MKFNIDTLKEHKWIIAVVVVGAFVVYRVINSGSAASTTSGTSTPANDAAMANISAAEQNQQTVSNAQVQQAQIAADAQGKQVDASVQIAQDSLAAQLAQVAAALDLGKYQTDAQVTQAGMQQRVQLDSIAASTQQAALADQVTLAQTSAAADIEKTYLGESYNLAMQHETDQTQINKEVFDYTSRTGLANTPNRDNLNSVTGLLQTLLAGGTPTVAATALNSNTAVLGGDTAAGIAKTGAVTGIVSGVLKGLFA